MKPSRIYKVVLATILFTSISTSVLADTVCGIKYINQLDKDSDYKLSEDSLNELSSNLNIESELKENFLDVNTKESNDELKNELKKYNILSEDSSIVVNKKGMDIKSKSIDLNDNVTKSDTLMMIYKSKFGVIEARPFIINSPSRRKIGDFVKKIIKTDEYTPVGYEGNSKEFDYSEGDYSIYVNPSVYELYLQYYIDNNIIEINELKDSKFKTDYTKYKEDNLSIPEWSNSLQDYIYSKSSNILNNQFGYSWKVNGVTDNTEKSFEINKSTPSYFYSENITKMDAYKYIYEIYKDMFGDISEERMNLLTYKLGDTDFNKLDLYNKNIIYSLLNAGLLNRDNKEEIKNLDSRITYNQLGIILCRIKDPSKRIDVDSILDNMSESDKKFANEGYTRKDITISSEEFAEPQTISVTEVEKKTTTSLFNYGINKSIIKAKAAPITDHHQGAANYAWGATNKIPSSNNTSNTNTNITGATNIEMLNAALNKTPSTTAQQVSNNGYYSDGNGNVIFNGKVVNGTNPLNNSSGNSDNATNESSSETNNGSNSESGNSASVDLSKKTVVIDPGHGDWATYKNSLGSDLFEDNSPDATTKMSDSVISGVESSFGEGSTQDGKKNVKDTGGTSNGDIYEYKVVWSVAEKLKSKLEAKGIKVIMTKSSQDADLGNIERAEIANNANANIELRIHCDSRGGDLGVLTLYSEQVTSYMTSELKEKSKNYANTIHSEFIKATGASDKGVKEQQLTGFNWGKTPQVLVELDDMDDLSMAQKLNSSDYQDKCAEGLYNGLLKVLEVSDNTDTTNKPESSTADTTTANNVDVSSSSTTAEKITSSSKTYEVIKFFPITKNLLYKNKSIDDLKEGSDDVKKIDKSDKGTTITFEINCSNDVRALSVIDSRIIYKGVPDGKAWQTVTKVETDGRSTTYIGSETFKADDSEIICIAEKLLKNRLTGETAVLLEDNDTALIGNRVVKTTDPMVIMNSDETYYNLDLIANLMTSSYVSSLCPDTIFGVKSLPSETIADVKATGGIIEKTVLFKPDKIPSDSNGTLANNTDDFFNLDMTARAMTSLTRQFTVNGKNIYAVIEWSYSVPDVNNQLYTFSTQDNSTFSVKEASEYLFTRPTDETEAAWWDKNINLSNAMCNCIYGTKDKEYFTSGFLKPDVTLLVESKDLDESTVVDTVFGNIQFSNSFKSKYCDNVSDFYKKLFGVDSRTFNIIYGTENGEITSYSNMYAVDSRGAVYKNATQDERTSYDSSKKILTISTRSNGGARDTVQDGTISISKDNDTRNFYLINSPSSEYYKLVYTSPIEGVLYERKLSDTKNIYSLKSDDSSDVTYKEITSLYNFALSAFNAREEQDLFKRPTTYKPIDYSNLPVLDSYQQNKFYLYNNELYTTSNDASMLNSVSSRPGFLNAQLGNPYIRYKINNASMFIGLKASAFPVIYAKKREFTVSNGVLTNQSSNPYLDLGNVFYSGLNSTLISRMMDENIANTKYSQLPDGAKVIIGDILFVKKNGVLNSSSYKDANLTNALANLEEDDEGIKTIIGNLFAGMQIYYSGRTVPFVDYITSVGLGSYLGETDNDTLVYNGSKKILKSDGTLEDYNYSSSLEHCSFKIDLEDKLRFYLLDPANNTYSLQCTSDEYGSGYISNVSMFAEDLGFTFNDDDMQNLVGNKYKELPNFRQTFENYKESYNQALKGDVLSIFKFFFYIMISYAILASWIAVAILKLHIGTGIFLWIRNPSGVKGSEGIDVVKIMTLGIWNLDSDPKVVSVIGANIIMFCLYYLVINSDAIIQLLFG